MDLMPKLIRITTVPISLSKLLTGQMRFMKANGFDVMMVSSEGTGIEQIINYEGCNHVVIPFTRKITPIQDIKCILILIQTFKRHKPDIVHTHTPKAGLLGMFAAWICNVPVRLHTVAGLPFQTTTGFKRRLLMNIEKITYMCSNEVWPNSCSLKEYILDNELCDPNKLKVIGRGSTNGIDPEDFKVESLEPRTLSTIKEKIKYNNRNKYLLFVGRVVKDKGIEELVRVFKRFDQIFENLNLIIVGPYEQELDPISPQVINEIENNSKIFFVGFSNEVKYFMYLADIFIFPSHREGFPNVPMQAALMDCPVIASNITGNIDIIENNVNGRLFEKGNEADLFSTINKALLEMAETNRMAKKLKEKVIKYYNRNLIHSLILEEYLQLLVKN